ncbi:unnamed protein product [Porites evermanni]|uniref:Uncharacterized protein n=1 Tax=Porites evermanni TaxID=104178 RepID=A0ABN8R190_9CNID|nr:unnamed protein product [Porites evermanni]
MASCGYSTFVGGPCGASPSNPADATCVALDKCTKDVKSHLNQYDCFDSSLKTEADLLLARAGLLHEFTAVSLYILFQGFSKLMIIILKCRFVHDIETPLVYDGVAAKEHVRLQKTGRRIRVNKSREIGRNETSAHHLLHHRTLQKRMFLSKSNKQRQRYCQLLTLTKLTRTMKVPLV